MKPFTRIIVTFSKNFVRLKSTSQTSAGDYCVNLVKKHDYENFLCTLLLAKNHRLAAFALRAFNIEVANVQSQVSEAHLGQMRLKFWEDTVDKIFSDNPPQHPVAVAVHSTLIRNALSKKHLQQLVLARENAMTTASFPSIEHMEKYAEKSSSPIYYLLLISAGVENVHADHAFSHLGKAQGLTNLIRSVPYYAQRRVVVLPQDCLNKHKVSHEAVIRGRADKSIRDVVFEVASRANSHITKVTSLSDEVPRPMRKHLLPAVPIGQYLERLRLADFDVFHPSLQLRDHKLPLKLLWKSWTGKV